MKDEDIESEREEIQLSIDKLNGTVSQFGYEFYLKEKQEPSGFVSPINYGYVLKLKTRKPFKRMVVGVTEFIQIGQGDELIQIVNSIHTILALFIPMQKDDQQSVIQFVRGQQ
jgi:pyruvate carboxylase